ncbi:MAG: hypothetical protein ACLR7Z_17150 [Bilophila wadsworthia]
MNFLNRMLLPVPPKPKEFERVLRIASAPSVMQLSHSGSASHVDRAGDIAGMQGKHGEHGLPPAAPSSGRSGTVAEMAPVGAFAKPA